MKLIQNQSGMSILQVMILGSIVLASSVILIQQTDIAESRRVHLNYQQQEKVVEKKINEYLSSKENCKKSFSSIVTMDNAGKIQMQSNSFENLKSNIVNDGQIEFDNVDFEIAEFGQVNAPSVIVQNEVNEMVFAKADLKIKINRESVMLKKLISRTANVKNIALPITFEFYNESGAWKLFSCESNFSNQEEVKLTQIDCEKSNGVYHSGTKICNRNTMAFSQRKANCEASGGVLNSDNLCVLPSVEYVVDNGLLTSPLKEKFTFQDSLCLLEHNISMQRSGVTPDSLFSQLCPRVKYGGCIDAKGQFYVSKNTFDNYLGQMGGNSLQTLISTTYSNGVEARIERLASQLHLPQDGLDINESIAIFKKRLSLSNYVNKLLGLMPSEILTSFVNMIFNCSNQRRVTANQTCENGKLEVNSITTQKQTFKCKKWSCKCRWVTDKVQAAPSEGAIAKALISQQMPPIPPIIEENVIDAASIEAEAAEQLKLMEIELNKLSSVQEFYAKISAISPENGEDAGTSYDATLDQTYTTKLKALIKKRELELWGLFRDKIQIDVTTKSTNEVFDYLHAQLSTISSLESKLEMAQKNETSDPAREAILTIEKSLINFLVGKINSSTTKAELSSFDPNNYSSRFTQATQTDIDVLKNTYSTKFSKL